MRVKSLVTFRSKSIGFEEAKMEKPVILDRGTGRPRAAAAQVIGRVEASGGIGIPDRGHGRDGRLHRAHRARIRRTRRRLPERAAAILPDRVGASSAQLNHDHRDLHPPLRGLP
jgi:hypothetical protein